MVARTKTKETEVVELTPTQQQIVDEVDNNTQAEALEKLVEMTEEMGLYNDEPNPMIKTLKEENYFLKLRQVDVGEHIEKKNGLSYLSWAYAVDLLYQHDAHANYEFLEPTIYPDGSVMVWCRLTAFGKVTTQYLPVMDFKNKAVVNPSATDINKAMQRCLAKAIAVGTGLGLYVYRGEDIPVDDTVDNEEKNAKKQQLIAKHRLNLESAVSMDVLKTAWVNCKKDIPETHPEYKALEQVKDQRKDQLLK